MITIAEAIANPLAVVCAFGRERERGHERRLDEPVGALADQPDREQPAEIGVAEASRMVPMRSPVVAHRAQSTVPDFGNGAGGR